MLRTASATLVLLTVSACVQLDVTGVSREYTGSLNGCPGLTGVSAIYSHSGPGIPVRCGPQTQAPVTYK